MQEIKSSEINHPEIKEFIDLVKTDIQNGVIEYQVLQEPRYMKYWKQLSISEYVESDDTFKFIFVGTEITTYLGREFTGITTREMLSDDSLYKLSYDMNIKVIKNKQLVYSYGNFEWENKELVKWEAVTLSAQKSSEIPLCLTFSVHFR